MSTEAELLERATIALERQGAAFERHEESHRRYEAAHIELMKEMKEDRALAQERHRHLMERSKRSETHFIEAMSEIQHGLEQNTRRLEDMGDEIRANTRAVLAVLDKL